jgi:N-acetylglutamate synthase-like GNAT family acetyltransferase
VLAEIERYYDAVPRSSARVEQIGSLTLFIGTGPGWGFYARPTLGVSLVVADEVELVRARQRALGIPETFEWVAETTPSMLAAVSATDLAVVQYPLMMLGDHVVSTTPPGAGVEVRLARLADDFGLLAAVGPLAFGAPGTAVGPAGVAEVRALAARTDPARARAEFNRERVRQGLTVMAVGFADGVPVGVGVHQPVGLVTEVAGVGVVPAFRRSGIGSALTSVLVADALGRGIRTVFLSAGDETIARVYARLGFERVGTACVAEPATARA